MKMEWLLCCRAVLYLLFGVFSSSNSATKKTSHTDCLTWRDDPESLQLICRVSDFVSPVTFFHNESQTEVKCIIRNKERGCTPKVKTFTIDQYTHTVTLILYENKTGRPLDGKWYCKQGYNIQSTEVSFSEGIIKDSSIYLHGTVENDSQYINVECSSCRIPKGPYAEISINGKLEASWLQSDKGCFLKGTPCSESNICHCTETKNAFSLRVQFPNAVLPANISCYMHFVDVLRGIPYQVTVSHKFEGKDFMETGNEITRFSNNKPAAGGLPTLGTHRTTATIKPTKSKSETTVNVETSWWKENSETVFAVCTVVAVAIIMVGICSVLFYVWSRKCNSATGKKRKQGHDEEKEVEPTNCQSCNKASEIIPASVFCFECYKIFCSECTSKDHAIHINVPISSFPPLFHPVSFFTCHNGSCHRFVCFNDKHLCCNKCKVYHNNDNCKLKDIRTISEEQICSEYEKDNFKLKEFKETIESYQKELGENKNHLTKQNKDNDELTTSQKETRDLLSSEINCYEIDLKNITLKIDTNLKLLELIDTRAEKCHLFIALQKLKDDLVKVEKKVGVLQNSLCQLADSVRTFQAKLNVQKLGIVYENRSLKHQRMKTVKKERILEKNIAAENKTNDDISSSSTNASYVDKINIKVKSSVCEQDRNLFTESYDINNQSFKHQFQNQDLYIDFSDSDNEECFNISSKFQLGNEERIPYLKKINTMEEEPLLHSEVKCVMNVQFNKSSDINIDNDIDKSKQTQKKTCKQTNSNGMDHQSLIDQSTDNIKSDDLIQAEDVENIVSFPSIKMAVQHFESMNKNLDMAK